MKTARAFLVVMASIVSALSWGWHEDKPAGAAFQPEVTDQRLSRDQSYQRTQGVVGQVEDARRESGPIDPETSSSQSEQDVMGAATDSEEAAQALRDADRVRRSEGSGERTVLSGALVLALIGCAFLAVRQWANRNIPEPLAVPHRKW